MFKKVIYTVKHFFARPKVNCAVCGKEGYKDTFEQLTPKGSPFICVSCGLNNIDAKIAKKQGNHNMAFEENVIELKGIIKSQQEMIDSLINIVNDLNNRLVLTQQGGVVDVLEDHYRAEAIRHGVGSDGF